MSSRKIQRNNWTGRGNLDIPVMLGAQIRFATLAPLLKLLIFTTIFLRRLFGFHRDLPLEDPNKVSRIINGKLFFL